jgi:hypothetical protein
MTQWLAAHPDVFMPKVKVPCHFGSDLEMTPKRRFRDLDTYLSLFSGVTTQRRVGESTPFYLYSERAAQEIWAFDPTARIIIMLRNPVDMMYSMHARNLMDGNERIRDFATALQAEATRRTSEHPPRGCYFRQGLYYRGLAHFPAQIRRYFDQFGRGQVHVVLFDELREDSLTVIRNVLSFLELDTEIAIPHHRANQGVVVKSLALAGFLREPPAFLQRLPAGVGHALAWRLNRWNRSALARPPLERNLRIRLLNEFAPEIDELAGILQRDLAHWLE